jgi:hypothetical protein
VQTSAIHITNILFNNNKSAYQKTQINKPQYSEYQSSNSIKQEQICELKANGAAVHFTNIS